MIRPTKVHMDCPSEVGMGISTAHCILKRQILQPSLLSSPTHGCPPQCHVSRFRANQIRASGLFGPAQGMRPAVYAPLHLSDCSLREKIIEERGRERNQNFIPLHYSIAASTHSSTRNFLRSFFYNKDSI